MNARHLPVALAMSFVASLATAELITINVDPLGTTSNQNVYGTVLSGGIATWPARGQFRDYQFELQTATGSTTFDAFAVKVSSQLRNSTVNYGNLLRATLWSGTTVANPLLADALVTVTTPNASFPNGSSGYSSVTLSGPAFVPQVVASTPSIFFFRIWAEGGSNDGYQTKMAASLGEQQAITMDPSPAIDGYLDIDQNDDGVVDNARDTISEVPEPASLALVAFGVLTLVGRRLVQRRS